MKKFLIVALVLFSAFCLKGLEQSYAFERVPFAPASYAPSDQGIGHEIGGYHVLAVLVPENTACMASKSKRVILVSEQPTIEGLLADVNTIKVTDALLELEQGQGVQLEAQYVGPNTTPETYLREIKKWNKRARRHGCIKTQPGASRESKSSPKASLPNKTEIKCTSSCPSWAAFENTNAGLFTDDNAQSVYLKSPFSIPNRPKALMFLNNVKTDHAEFYLLQNGLQFYFGAGSVVWTDTSQQYFNQPYAIPYSVNHDYWATISYSSGTWWMCMNDPAVPGSYRCQQETNGKGTTLAQDFNTSVWVENHNDTANWYSGFSTPLQAWGAEIFRNGVAQSWSNNHKHTQDDCTTSWPPTDAMGGDLKTGNTGTYKLPGVPIDC